MLSQPNHWLNITIYAPLVFFIVLSIQSPDTVSSSVVDDMTLFQRLSAATLYDPTTTHLPTKLLQTLVFTFVMNYSISLFVTKEKFTPKEAIHEFPWGYAIVGAMTQPFHQYLMVNEWMHYDLSNESIPHFFLSIILCLLVVDACLYWGHVFQHKYLMVFHQVHHSLTADVNMNSIVGGYTAHIADTLLMQLLVICVPPLLIPIAMHPLAHWSVTVFTGYVSVTLHSEAPTGTKMGIFTAPDEHRLHHMNATSQKNFSMLFKHWDLIMGTYSNPHPYVMVRRQKAMKARRSSSCSM